MELTIQRLSVRPMLDRAIALAKHYGLNLKEGIPEGLSEMGGLQRWTMEDRMEHSHSLDN